MAAPTRAHSRPLRSVLLVLALAMAGTAPSLEAGTPRSFTVLALRKPPDDAGSAAAHALWYATLREVLKSRVHGSIDLFQESVPFDRLATSDSSRALRDYLRERYRSRRPDLVIASTSSVRDFVLQYRDELFPGIPLVIEAAWTSHLSPAERQRDGGIAAVELSNLLIEPLELALRLHPRARHAYVLVGRTSPALLANLRRAHEAAAGGVPVTFITDLPVPEMLRALEQIPPDSVVFYINYVQEVPGRTLSELQVAQLVTGAAAAPVYGFLESHLGLGIVGGVVLTPRNEAAQVGRLAARILNGERPGDLPVEQVDLVPMFDWRQLQRWRLDEAMLPAAADIRFRELTPWQRHRWVILGTLAVVALQGALIAGLVAQRARRRQMFAALTKAQARYTLASGAARVGVWEWEPGSGAFYVDPAVRTLAGGAGVDVPSRLEDWLALVHPDDRAAVDGRLREHARGTSAAVETEHRLLQPDGTIRWVQLRGSVARDGGATRIVGTIADATDRKRAEQRLQDIQGELSRIARVTALGEFAASIAHEVRQPLTAIISSARAAARFLNNGATTDAQEALWHVLEASKRADRVIERNRELFRNHTVQKELLDPNRVVIESLAIARSRLEASQVSLVTSLTPALPMIEGDPIELQQVLLNLTANAIDALQAVAPASRRLEIATGCGPAGTIRVSVSDNGVGLGAVDVRRLFTFSYTTKPGGTGVGLSISRSIIEAHGGTLCAEGRAGQGATFTFVLPVAQVGAGRADVAS